MSVVAGRGSNQGLAAVANLPDPGQLVTVRERQYVVLEVSRSSLTSSPLRGGLPPAQHLVTLSSIEDDALGEELSVIWEVEPGARAHEKLALPEPTGFDDPRRLDAFLDAVRWGASSSADIRAVRSPFHSGIEIEDYQLDPVVRAIQMPRVSLLVADDVGLGKTIESGLVLQELILRHRVRTALVVCPAALQIQWRDQMRDKFGLEFRIVDSALMKELRRRRGLHVNPWTHFPRLIASIDFLKRERPMRLFREALPAEGQAAYPRRFDLMIVDECHNIAPSGVGRYATDSQRTFAIRTLAPHFEHKLFLSATPHNGYPESFTALLELLDNQRFARGVRPSREQLGAVMVRRLKSELRDALGTAKFPARKLEVLEVDYPEAERRAHEALREYTRLRQSSFSDESERFATEFVLKLLKKRLFSSPAAFAMTLEKHERSLQTARRRSGSPVARPSAGILRRQVDDIEEEFDDDQLYEESAAELVETATRLFREPTPEEQALLRELREFAQKSSARPDAKARALLQWLRSTLKPDGRWSDERVILFTEYRATQKWLQGLLAAEGFVDAEANADRLLVLYGGMPTDERERIKAAFQANPKDSAVRILLATDAASEGIDLQNHCSRLVHYEIPWNPNRMEQRNGRVDRHGQRAAEVRVYHFVGTGYLERQRIRAGTRPGDLEGDLEFLMRAAEKVNTIREDLGKVGPVIASQVEDAMLGRRQQLDTDKAERGAEPVRRMLKFERKLREQVQKLTDQLQESRQALRLSPENLQTVVEIGLELTGQPPLRETRLPGLWPDPTGHRTRCPVFHMPALSGSWALCSEGLEHPHTQAIRPIVFDHELVQGRDDVVLVHLNHRLVQMCLRLLRSEVWSREGRKRLHRVAARLVPDSALRSPAVVAHARLVVLGGDSKRLHEELITAGGLLREGRFATLGVRETSAALAAALQDEPPESRKKQLAGLWPTHRESLFRALETRARERTESLSKTLAERVEKESADLRAIFDELERSIRTELREPEVTQLELFTSTEREQLERNRSSLELRLEELPAELEQELSALRARYADPAPRLFPVAVTYLIPQSYARGA